MNQHLAIPLNDSRAGILLVHAWWGLNDMFKNLCDRLAAKGYLTLAPDLYHGQTAATIPEAEKLRKTLKRETVSADILKALEGLQAQIPGKPVGVMGFSLGAHWALWLAETRPEALSAVVIFYGNRGGLYTATQAAFLGHFAETDPYVSASGRKNLEKTLTKTGKTVEFYDYPQTHHWFFEPDRPEYDPGAAALAWERTLDFLRRRLG